MSTKTTFERYELKYLITREQRELLQQYLQTHMTPDAFGQSTIYNLYCDTPDFRLIRRSMEKPIYKEKLRLRSYGRATAHSTVFLELKKKYDHVVYKRRLSLATEQATRYLTGQGTLPEGQIAREIDYVNERYPQLAPRMFISYAREAWFGQQDSSFRMTFDENIQWRTERLTLSSDPSGTPILPPDTVLLEVKVAGGLPLWLTSWLSEHGIYKISYSKYGTAYTQMIRRGKEHHHAA